MSRQVHKQKLSPSSSPPIQGPDVQSKASTLVLGRGRTSKHSLDLTLSLASQGIITAALPSKHLSIDESSSSLGSPFLNEPPKLFKLLPPPSSESGFTIDASLPVNSSPPQRAADKQDDHLDSVTQSGPVDPQLNIKTVTTSTVFPDENHLNTNHISPLQHDSFLSDLIESPNPNYVERTAERLFRLLISDELSCTRESHIQEQTLHMATAGTNHYELSATYNTSSASSQRSFTSDVGINSNRLPGNDGMPRRIYPSATRLRDLFEGRERDEDEIPNICLHQEMVSDGQPLQSFDIDSVLLFPCTLAAFKKGFRYYPALQIAQNIQTDIHVEYPVTYFDHKGKRRQQNRQLRNIPHLYIGSVDGIHRSNIYLFFPGLIEDDEQFVGLTKAQMQRFIDGALLPTCREYLESDRVQYLPPNQETAELAARAKGVEHQTARRERGLKEHVSYSIRSGHLDEVWRKINIILNDPHNKLADFQKPFLLVNAKGIKMDFKETGSLHQALSKFEAHLQELFDLDLMDRMLVDIGREICSPTPYIPIHSEAALNASSEEPCVYLWKKCCLRRLSDSFTQDSLGGTPGQVSFYHIGLLRDAVNMTFTPPKRSGFYQGGWLYGQWYSSAKRIVDAQKTYPFDHSQLKELAIDPSLWNAYVGGKGGLRIKYQQSLVDSYCGSKRRVRDCYHTSKHTSFGVRMEFRVEWDLFQAICRLALQHEETFGVSIQLPHHPESTWAIQTQRYVRFMMGNYDKLTSALEMARATSPQTGVPLERTKLMLTLIRCLQAFQACELRRHSALWYDKRWIDGTITRGLGFETTLTTYGYAWFKEVVDWENFQFESSMTSQMVKVDRYLHYWYRSAGSLIHDTTQILDACFARLHTGSDSASTQLKILEAVAHFCLQRYRRDALNILGKELRSSIETDADKDNIQFCYEGLREAFIDPPNLVKGNKTKVKTPDELMEWIWGTSEDYNRTHFNDKPFRVMCQKVRKATEDQPALSDQWSRILLREFCTYHWVVPYPDINGTLISTAKGSRARQWWAINSSNDVKWVWGRDVPRTGRPRAYPSTLTMSVDELMRYFDQGEGRGEGRGEGGGKGNGRGKGKVRVAVDDEDSIFAPDN